MDFEKIRNELELANIGTDKDEIGYDVVCRILAFIKDNDGKKVAIFLHTSTVSIRKHNLEIMKKLKSKNVTFYIPDNCICELNLLKKYSSMPVLRKKAENLLNIFGDRRSASHKQMVDFQESVSKIYGYDKALFVFCEPAAASEFSRKFCFDNKNFILSYNPYLTGREKLHKCSAGEAVSRSCKPISNTLKLSKPDKISIKNADGIEKMNIAFSSLGGPIGGGGEADIYETEKMPGKVIKIYSEFYPGEDLVKKIKCLASFYHSTECCAFPSELVYCGDKCIGFVMDKVDGDTLGKAISNVLSNTNKKKKQELMLNFSASLLEARINQLIVADLSPRNAIVKNDGRVVFIDVDSMEFSCYPGGSITKPFGHPGFDIADAYSRLRTLEETGFSYAVMMFWFTMGWEYPNSQKGVAIEDLDWNTHKFPFGNTLLGKGCEVSGTSVKKEKLDIWKSQAKHVREGFVDVFTKHKTYDIGEWLKRLDLNI